MAEWGEFLALCHNVRVWVHPRVREWCRGDFSYLGDILARIISATRLRLYHGFNHAVFIVVDVADSHRARRHRLSSRFFTSPPTAAPPTRMTIVDVVGIILMWWRFRWPRLWFMRFFHRRICGKDAVRMLASVNAVHRLMWHTAR